MPVNADDTVKCIDCAHFRLKDAGQMGKLGAPGGRVFLTDGG